MTGTWNVAAPHGPIENVANNLWRVEGDVPRLPLKRVMAIVRLSDGGLLIHGAIALEESAMKQLEALGEPSVLLVPSGYHRMDAPKYARRYPKMRVFCPEGAVARVAAVVRVDGTYDDFPPDRDVELDSVYGIGAQEGVVRIASDDGATLVFNDILFNMPDRGLFTRIIGSSGGPRVSRTARFFLIKDARVLAARFIALAATPRLVRVMVAHDQTIVDQPAETLRQVAATLC